MNLTIDVGTTNTKLSLWDRGTQSAPIQQIKFPTPKTVVHDNTNFDLSQLLRELENHLLHIDLSQRKKIQKIAIASVGETGVLLDESGQIVSSAIAWYDTRSQAIIDGLSASQKYEIYQITGLPAHVHYSASKIAWLLENEVDSNRSYTWLCIPDYLCYQLTGAIATEYSLASRTMVYDLKRRVWSTQIKDIFNIQNVSFPKVYPAGQQIGTVLAPLAQKLGLAQDVTVVIAGHDHMVGSLVSKQKSDEIFDSTGTTEGILLVTPTLTNDLEKEAAGIAHGIYVDPKYYTVFTALPSAGSVIKWFTDRFAMNEKQFMTAMNSAYNQYLNQQFILERVPWIIPHFNGSGSPNKAINTRGLIYGITTQTTTEEMILGMFLGLTFELKHALESMTSERISKIKLVGPAILDPLWVQLRADLLAVDVEIIEEREAVSQGANIIASSYQKQIKQQAVETGAIYTPNKNEQVIKQLLEIYHKKYLPLYQKKIELEIR
ncbi:FGGY family carbohydrate kinase [Bombilactobacillus folatiphilus]|uniref:FGGY family carbohydrate kinase n=1 Tax=Bombilactobacillus folatiphilus TaxID=2923362 RepID=A0ABY4P955_9LACO|nr:FGGY family carbohydrate kinase [Bombilactobacillus folatiphilus]UQS82278.1 FGGY family carbohydrate kinase [Bombilactobacillus folatiphilus]